MTDNGQAALINAVVQLLEDAKRQFGADAVARLERTLGEYVGQLPRTPPESPLQRPPLYFPGLTAKPWHDAARFDWVPRVEAGFETIRRELLGLLERQRGFARYRYDGAQHTPDGWKVFYLSHPHMDCADNRALCPETWKLASSIPRLDTPVMFSALNPGNHILPHCGSSNFKLVMHMGLVVPEGDCAMRVATETRPWKEGRVTVFDDSFDHEAWNRGATTRFNFFAILWHPDLTDLECKVLKHIDMMHSEYAKMVDPARHAAELEALRGTKWWV